MSLFSIVRKDYRKCFHLRWCDAYNKHWNVRVHFSCNTHMTIIVTWSRAKPNGTGFFDDVASPLIYSCYGNASMYTFKQHHQTCGLATSRAISVDFSQALVLYTRGEVLMYFSDRQGEFRKRTTKNVLTPVKLRGYRSWKSKNVHRNNILCKTDNFHTIIDV